MHDPRGLFESKQVSEKTRMVASRDDQISSQIQRQERNLLGRITDTKLTQYFRNAQIGRRGRQSFVC